MSFFIRWCTSRNRSDFCRSLSRSSAVRSSKRSSTRRSARAPGAGAQLDEMVRLERLSQIAGGAGPHERYRKPGVAVAGDDDARGVGPGAPQLREEQVAGAVRQIIVYNDHVEAG